MRRFCQAARVRSHIRKGEDLVDARNDEQGTGERAADGVDFAGLHGVLLVGGLSMESIMATRETEEKRVISLFIIDFFEGLADARRKLLMTIGISSMSTVFTLGSNAEYAVPFTPRRSPQARFMLIDEHTPLRKD